MHTSQLGVGTVARSEGCYLRAYRCPAGVWTIGFGHTSAMGAPEVVPGMVITREEALTILQNDLRIVEQQVLRAVQVKLTQGQFDALVSFVFNVGIGNFRRSTLLRFLNRGRYDAVAPQLMRWTRAGGKVLPGLIKRRRAEVALWDGISTQLIVKHDGPIAQAVTAPRRELHPAVLPSGVTAGALELWRHFPTEAIEEWLTRLHNSAVGHYIGLVFTAIGLVLVGVTLGFYFGEKEERGKLLGNTQEKDHLGDSSDADSPGLVSAGDGEPPRAADGDR